MTTPAELSRARAEIERLTAHNRAEDIWTRHALIGQVEHLLIQNALQACPTDERLGALELMAQAARDRLVGEATTELMDDIAVTHEMTALAAAALRRRAGRELDVLLERTRAYDVWSRVLTWGKHLDGLLDEAAERGEQHLYLITLAWVGGEYADRLVAQAQTALLAEAELPVTNDSGF